MKIRCDYIPSFNPYGSIDDILMFFISHRDLKMECDYKDQSVRHIFFNNGVAIQIDHPNVSDEFVFHANVENRTKWISVNSNRERLLSQLEEIYKKYA